MSQKVKNEGKESFTRKGIEFEPGKVVEVDRPFAPGDWRYIVQKGCKLIEDMAEAVSDAVAPKPVAAKVEPVKPVAAPADEVAPRRRGRPRKTPTPTGAD